MQIDMEKFRDAFYVEAEEHLQHMEAALLQLELCNDDPELLNTIFRAAHSMKGASLTFGIEQVGKFTHILESLLDSMREGRVKATSDLVELLLESVDVIEALIGNARENSPLPPNLLAVTGRLENANQATPSGSPSKSNNLAIAATSSGPQNFLVRWIPSRAIFSTGLDPLLLLDEIRSLGTIESFVLKKDELPDLETLECDQCYVGFELVLSTEASRSTIEDVFLFVDSDQWKVIDQPVEAIESETTPEASSEVLSTESDAPGNPLPSKNRSGRNENETVRVDKQRLDDLVNQIGELVIAASMVEQGVRGKVAEAEDASTTLNKIVRDLQQMSLSLRMVPIAATFQRLNRVIRDSARMVGKQIELVTEGDDTELDKTVVDQIGDPLIHMVRNSVDHGIESPEDRLAAGKSAQGTISVKAYQQGGNIYIRLQDDGRGLNRERILAKAIEKGLVPSENTLTDAEIDNLIFLPGFSTASTVTELSGRGVGMDVVRRNVESLQGSITVRSQEGHGTTLTVRLPLTLAILDGLLLKIGDECFVLPLLSVVESIRVAPNQIRNLVGSGELIVLRGEMVPVVRLRNTLGVTAATNSGPTLVVIVENEGRKLALAVDDLLGQQQIVVKNLEINYRKVDGVAGATILGDGRVALIIDVAVLETLHNRQGEDSHLH